MSNNQYPDGWTEMTFGEMAEQVSERVDDPKTAGVEVYVGLEHLDPEDLRIRRRGTPDDVEATKLRVRPGQIIFGKRRAYQRKVAVADFDGIASAHAMILQEKPVLYPGFLPFFMQSDTFMDRAVTISEGGLSPTIKWKTLAAEKFLLPPPEQQRELVELMQGFERAIEAGEEVFEAQVALTGAVVENGYADISTSRRCDEICDDITVGVVVKPASYYVPEGVPALRSLNVLPNKLNMENLVYFSNESNDLLAKSKLRSGDVLVVRSGTPGIACAIPEGAVGINCIDLIIVRPKKELLDSRYLAYFLNSEQGKRQTARHAGGLAQQHVNVGALKTVEVPFVPLELQRVFVQGVAASLAQDEVVASHVSHIKALRFSILNTALSPSAQAEAAAEVTP